MSNSYTVICIFIAFFFIYMGLIEDMKMFSEWMIQTICCIRFTEKEEAKAPLMLGSVKSQKNSNQFWKAPREEDFPQEYHIKKICFTENVCCKHTLWQNMFLYGIFFVWISKCFYLFWATIYRATATATLMQQKEINVILFLLFCVVLFCFVT